MAAPTLFSIGTASSGTGTRSVALPSHQAGDIAILLVETANDVIATPAGGWAIAPNAPQGIGTASAVAATRLSVFWLRCSGGATPNASVAFATTGNHIHAQILVYRDCIASGDPFDGSAGNTAAAGTAVTIPGFTTTKAESLVTAIVANATDSTSRQGSGSWTNASLASLTDRPTASGNTTQGNGGGWDLVTGIKTAAGAVSSTTTTIGSSVQARYAFALKPAATALVLEAQLGAFAQTGQSSTLRIARRAEAQVGAFALAGSSASPRVGRTIAANDATFASAGAAATLRVSRRIEAQNGAHALSGAAAQLLRNLRLELTSGALLSTGSPSELTFGRRIIASPSSTVLSGAPASLLGSRVLAAQAGAFSLSGSDSSIERSMLMLAQQGAYALGGSNADLIVTLPEGEDIVLTALLGAFASEGAPAGMNVQRRVSASPAAVSLSGAQAGLRMGRRLAAQAGELSLAGAQVALRCRRLLSAQEGALSVVGSTVQATLSRRVAAQTGAFLLEGFDLISYTAPVGGGTIVSTIGAGLRARSGSRIFARRRRQRRGL